MPKATETERISLEESIPQWQRRGSRKTRWGVGECFAGTMEEVNTVVKGVVLECLGHENLPLALFKSRCPNLKTKTTYTSIFSLSKETICTDIQIFNSKNFWGGVVLGSYPAVLRYYLCNSWQCSYVVPGIEGSYPQYYISGPNFYY